MNRSLLFACVIAFVFATLIPVVGARAFIITGCTGAIENAEVFIQSDGPDCGATPPSDDVTWGASGGLECVTVVPTAPCDWKHYMNIYQFNSGVWNLYLSGLPATGLYTGQTCGTGPTTVECYHGAYTLPQGDYYAYHVWQCFSGNVNNSFNLDSAQHNFWCT